MIQSTDFALIILAAGMGKRTGSSLPKVLIKTSEGIALIGYVLKTIKEISPSRLLVVVGNQKELVQEDCGRICSNLGLNAEYCVQEQQKGTGDAVKACTSSLANFSGPVVILCGDMPLIESRTLDKLLKTHEDSKATLTLVTLDLEEDNSFGRILRSSEGLIQEIRERKDCSPEQAQIKEKNLGIYCVESSFLFSALERIRDKNAQSEYYLTDIVQIAAKEEQRISSISCSQIQEALGVNDMKDLLDVSQALRKGTIDSLARKGVTFLAPESVVIDPEVEIESGVVIGPSVQIKGKSKIGAATMIEGTSIITDSIIGSNCYLKLGSYITRAILEDSVTIGPFAQIRPDSHLQENVIIGNFVELKNAKLAKGVKANHLSYLGDCEVGEDSNIGAGTITCNYDGVKKSRTTIGSKVFVGSNTALVAPVQLGDGCVIGAGSVITKNVEADALALTRTPQLTKSGWAKRR
jgi:bifunctional UDP-N-acetylglucosamine pyrophosphorylase/glucosamine-1-phosphate N-acetyltransferase